MAKLEIGAQLFTLRELMKTPEEIHEGFKKVRDIGFKVAQVSGLGPIEPERLRDISEETGVKICITHTPYNRIKDDLDNVIKEHRIFGCDVIGLGAMPRDYWEGGLESYRKFVKEANEITKKVKAAGMDFSYHNHRFEFEKLEDGRLGIDVLLEDIPDMCFTLDTYWVQAGGASPVEYIKKTAGRVKVLHLKDMRIRNNEQLFAEIGEGNINFLPIYAAAVEAGTKIAVIEQDNCYGRNPFDSLKLSLENITRDYLSK